MSYTDNWEIQDENGVIHSGTKDEMEEAWDTIVHSNWSVKELAIDQFVTQKSIKEARKKWLCDWVGDLKLIQIHDIHN